MLTGVTITQYNKGELTNIPKHSKVAKIVCTMSVMKFSSQYVHNAFN